MMLDMLGPQMFLPQSPTTNKFSLNLYRRYILNFSFVHTSEIILLPVISVPDIQPLNQVIIISFQSFLAYKTHYMFRAL